MSYESESTKVLCVVCGVQVEEADALAGACRDCVPAVRGTVQALEGAVKDAVFKFQTIMDNPGTGGDWEGFLASIRGLGPLGPPAPASLKVPAPSPQAPTFHLGKVFSATVISRHHGRLHCWVTAPTREDAATEVTAKFPPGGALITSIDRHPEIEVSLARIVSDSLALARSR